jgi:hypothetical protein
VCSIQHEMQLAKAAMEQMAWLVLYGFILVAAGS